MKEILINTQEGFYTVSKDWVKKQIESKDNIIKLISETYFINNRGSTWSISKLDFDTIFTEIRDDKITTILS